MATYWDISFTKCCFRTCRAEPCCSGWFFTSSAKRREVDGVARVRPELCTRAFGSPVRLYNGSSSRTELSLRNRAAEEGFVGCTPDPPTPTRPTRSPEEAVGNLDRSEGVSLWVAVSATARRKYV